MPLPIVVAIASHVIHAHVGAAASGAVATAGGSVAVKKLLETSPAARTDALLEKLDGLDERVVSVPDDRVEDAMAACERFRADEATICWISGAGGTAGASRAAGLADPLPAAAAAVAAPAGTALLRRDTTVAVSAATPSEASMGTGGDSAESDAEHDRQARERHALTVRSFVERDVARARRDGYCLAFTEEGTTRGTMVGLATVQILHRNGTLPAFKTSLPGALVHKSFWRRLRTLNKCSQSIYGSIGKPGNHWYLSSLSSTMDSGKQADVVLDALVRAVTAAADEEYVGIYTMTSDPRTIDILKHHQFKVTGGSWLTEADTSSDEAQITGLLRTPYRILRAKPRSLAAVDDEAQRRKEAEEMDRMARAALSQPDHLISGDVDYVVEDDGDGGDALAAGVYDEFDDSDEDPWA